jgi:serine/threonine-protein kinase
MGGLSNWFAELRRRRVFRALIGYGIAAFAVLQVIEPIMHGAHWPETVLSYVVAALAAGFPIVITLAWIFDVKAGRIERTAPAAGATGPRGVRLALLLVGIGVLAATPGVLYYFVLRGSARSTSARWSDPAGSTTSIAVLPFASLSSGEENAYFAQGFHDELLWQMGRIGALRVISRTSVLQYKEGARNLREIAEALGVSSIVEGSVQRAGNRVRVEAKLIDARSDRQIWGAHYDRDVTDIFAIQTAVAEEIASALHAQLSAAQKAQIERKPTQSPEAYDLYLRALEYAHRPGYEPRNLEIAEGLYRKAIQMDSSFALARARLACVKIETFWFVAGTPDRVAEEAREEAEQSLRLQPDLPDGHLALGLYHYHGRRDYDRALEEFEIARSGLPAEAIVYIGWVARRQGKFEEAIRNQQEALRLDPRSPGRPYELAFSFLSTRRYEEADRLLDRALAIAPDFILASIVKAVVHEAWKGEADLAKDVLRALRGRLDPRGLVGAYGWLGHLLQYNPGEAVPFLDSIDSESITGYFAVYPKAFLYAVAHEALGDAARARREYETALPLLQSEVDKNPGSAIQLIVLARAYASLGRKEDALQEAQRAVGLLPISKDAFLGPDVEIDRAAVEARVGETDAAIEHIRHLLSIPCLLSPGLLRIDPRWAPLRNDPRFRKLAELGPE